MNNTTTGTPRHVMPADSSERYLGQIRNMLAWMLIIFVTLIAGAVGTGIYLGVHDAQAHQDNGRLCQSLGGTNPSC